MKIILVCKKIKSSYKSLKPEPHEQRFAFFGIKKKSAYKVTPSVLEIGELLNVPGLNLICIHPSEQFLYSTKSIDISPGEPPKEACLDSSEAAF